MVTPPPNASSAVPTKRCSRGYSSGCRCPGASAPKTASAQAAPAGDGVAGVAGKMQRAMPPFGGNALPLASLQRLVHRKQQGGRRAAPIRSTIAVGSGGKGGTSGVYRERLGGRGPSSALALSRIQTTPPAANFYGDFALPRHPLGPACVGSPFRLKLAKVEVSLTCTNFGERLQSLAGGFTGPPDAVSPSPHPGYTRLI